MYGVDTGGRVTFANAAAAATLQRSQAELLRDPPHLAMGHGGPAGELLTADACPLCAVSITTIVMT